MVIAAMQDFSKSFHGYAKGLSKTSLANQKESVKEYYRSEFGRKYSSLNANEQAEINALIFPLDADSIALQYDYISNNSNPLGNKNALFSLSNNTEYDLFHQKYHGIFNNFIERFGYYDLFLVDHITGDIVYSVFKELDYSTSLKDGPYANTAIGKAFSMAIDSSKKGFTGLTDFAPYVPSYNAPASFIATPIFDDERMVGVLILQMPVDRINEVMTYGQIWEESGLGLSGETYLVGQDFKMRSNGRFLLEDKENYLQLMQDIGMPNNDIEIMRNKSTSIGLQTVKTKGTEHALKGESGFDIFPDYRGITVLSAYKTISVGGLEWAIMSEIDEAEAFSPVNDLQARISYLTTIIIILAVLFGPLLAYLLVRSNYN